MVLLKHCVWIKNADPTPAPPLQGLGAHSKCDSVSREVINNDSPLLLGRGIIAMGSNNI